MITYVLAALIVIPLALLVVDVFMPKRDHASPAAHGVEIRPHVTASTIDRRDVHRADPVVESEPRPPRIAPGDGMVYRPAHRPSQPR